MNSPRKAGALALGLSLILGTSAALAQAPVVRPAAPARVVRGYYAAPNRVYYYAAPATSRPANGYAPAPAAPRANDDWSTGRSIRLSKPWMRPLR